MIGICNLAVAKLTNVNTKTKVKIIIPRCAKYYRLLFDFIAITGKLVKNSVPDQFIKMHSWVKLCRLFY